MNRFMTRLRQMLIAAVFPRRERGFHRVGSDYGGWYVPDVNPTWICCTVGVGEDATFDVGLAEAGCRVVAVDPTPGSIEYMRPVVAKHKRLTLLPYALWTERTDLTFYPPRDPTHVSYSATNLQGTSEPITVPARTLDEILAEAGVTHLDLLKLDIEGAEYQVVPAIDLDRVGVRVLCVEYHFDQHGISGMIRAIRAVERRGFRVAHVWRTDVTFMRSH